MNKTKIAVIITILLILIIGGLFVIKNGQNTNKFKEEYESLNGKKNDSGKTYKTVEIPADNPIVYSNYKEIFELLDGTGVIYFGFPECPWCRNAVPVLIDAALETGIEKIYYLNNLDDRNILTLKDGEIITEKEGTDNYKKLLEKLGDNASIYEGLEDDSIKRLYFPTVIAVKNGKIVNTIVGTVPSQEDPYVSLTKKQTEELKNNYMDAINKTLLCSTDEKC